jgi:hypothetical protein
VRFRNMLQVARAAFERLGIRPSRTHDPGVLLRVHHAAGCYAGVFCAAGQPIEIIFRRRSPFLLRAMRGVARRDFVPAFSRHSGALPVRRL